MASIFGIDLSEFDAGKRKVNFERIKEHEPAVGFIATRCSVGHAYSDPSFSDHWSEMGRLGFNRIAYHVVYFGDSALNQMDTFFAIVSGDARWSVDRLALTFNEAGLNPKERITSTALKCLEICQARTGRYPIIYTRANWMNANIDVTMLPRLHYWLADYEKPRLPFTFSPEKTSPPALPIGVTNWLIHQTGDRCKPFGTHRRFMNYDRFNGGRDDLLYFFGKAGEVSPSLASPLQFQARCIVNALYTRNGPAAAYPVIGTISLGDIINIYEVRDSWFRIDPSSQVWVSGSRSYLLPLSDTELMEAGLFEIKVVAPGLYKRSGPGFDAPVVGTLSHEEIVSVYQINGDWYRISPGAEVWCSAGSQYVQKL